MDTTKNAKSKLSKRKIGLIAVLIILLITVLITAGFVYRNIKERNEHIALIAHMTNTVEKDTFYDGLYLDDFSLGGLTLEQAKDEFSKRAGEQFEKFRVELVYEDQSWIFDHEDIGAKINWEEKLDDLYEVARTGELEERYNEVVGLKEQGLHVETELAYDIGLIKEEIFDIAESLSIEAIDADIKFYPNQDEKFELFSEELGQKVDGEQLYIDASDILKSQLPSTINIEPEAVEPKYTEEQLAKGTYLISSYSTNLGDSSANRAHNVILALDKLNGSRIDPGEVFSFNDGTGPRTKGNGFLSAPVITAEKTMEDDYGGGVCQSSTTFFNAVALAGLDIIERNPHSYPIAYVPKGRDAMVSYGWSDVKVKNNQDTPVFIRTYSKNRNVFVEIYGQPVADGGKYDLEPVLVESMPAPTPKLIEDKEGKYVSVAGQQRVHVKSRPGYKVDTYRVLYRDGKKVSSDLLVASFYRPIQGTTYYLPKEEKPEPTPTPTPVPTQEPSGEQDASPGDDDSAKQNDSAGGNSENEGDTSF